MADDEARRIESLEYMLRRANRRRKEQSATIAHLRAELEQRDAIGPLRRVDAISTEHGIGLLSHALNRLPPGRYYRLVSDWTPVEVTRE